MYLLLEVLDVLQAEQCCCLKQGFVLQHGWFPTYLATKHFHLLRQHIDVFRTRQARLFARLMGTCSQFGRIVFPELIFDMGCKLPVLDYAHHCLWRSLQYCFRQ